MQKQNFEEYEIIRKEIIEIKNCITNYLGYVIGGTGISCLSLVWVSKSNYQLTSLGFISFASSFLVSLITIIVLYKFSSHNRFAGYSKLLTFERHRNLDEISHLKLEQTESNSKTYKDLDSYISWHFCYSCLRKSNSDPNYFDNLIDQIQFDGVDKCSLELYIKKFSDNKSEVNKGKIFKGTKILLNSLLGKVKSASWIFPGFVIAIYFIIFIVFFTSSFVLFTFGILQDNISINQNIIAVLSLSTTAIAMIYAWYMFIGQLYDLMEGSQTIDSYMFKFLPIRAVFINNHFIYPIYNLADLGVIEESLSAYGIDVNMICKK